MRSIPPRPLRLALSTLATGVSSGVAIGVALLVAIGVPAGCDPGSTQGEIAPCVCDNGGCTTQACPMIVTLDQTCVGEMRFAEVLVDDHVESVEVHPQEPATLCSRVEPGDESTVWVRGGPWVWGPLRETCANAAEAQQIVLQCVEAQ